MRTNREHPEDHINGSWRITLRVLMVAGCVFTAALLALAYFHSH